MDGKDNVSVEVIDKEIEIKSLKHKTKLLKDLEKVFSKHGIVLTHIKREVHSYDGKQNQVTLMYDSTNYYDY